MKTKRTREIAAAERTRRAQQAFCPVRTNEPTPARLRALICEAEARQPAAE